MKRQNLDWYQILSAFSNILVHQKNSDCIKATKTLSSPGRNIETHNILQNNNQVIMMTEMREANNNTIISSFETAVNSMGSRKTRKRNYVQTYAQDNL
jgi:hypothetical protein